MSFRTFAWLLVRRAYLQMIDDHPDELLHGYVRRTIRDARTDTLRRLAARFIEHNPKRRFRP